MEQLHLLEQRVRALEKKVSDEFQDVNTKLDTVLEIVQVGKAALLFAKIAGWMVGACASALGVWSYFKGK
jgi:hypothetical protein